MNRLLCIINCQNVVIKYNTRVWREYLQQKDQIISRIINNLNNLLFFSCVYINKMANITRKTHEANGIEVITDKLGELWLNERHVQEQLGLKNLPALTNQYPKEFKKQRSELNESTEQPNRRFIHVKLALKIIMNCRTDESCKFFKKVKI